MNRPAARAAVLLASLGPAMTLRLAVGGDLGGASPVGGVVFALVLAALAGPSRPRRAGRGERWWSTGLIGGVGAAVLLVGPVLHYPGMQVHSPLPAIGAFLPWVAATSIVAIAEEMLLRGALYDAARQAWGRMRPAWAADGVAVAIGAIAFAAIHVPLYGTVSLPLDLGVGICLGCLRVASGGWAAPAVAHVLADAGGWWLR